MLFQVDFVFELKVRRESVPLNIGGCLESTAIVSECRMKAGYSLRFLGQVGTITIKHQLNDIFFD